MERQYIIPSIVVIDLYAKDVMQLPAEVSEPTFEDAKNTVFYDNDEETDSYPQQSIWDE